MYNTIPIPGAHICGKFINIGFNKQSLNWLRFILFKHYSTSIVGSVVECSPATRAARVRFPDEANFFFLLQFDNCFTPHSYLPVVARHPHGTPTSNSGYLHCELIVARMLLARETSERGDKLFLKPTFSLQCKAKDFIELI